MRVDSGLRDLIDKAVPLTEYAWRFRYPGGVDEAPTLGEATEALAIAHEVIAATIARLPSEVSDSGAR